MAVIKRVLCPQRLRRVPRQFSWIDHRLVRDRHIVGRSAEALALYLLLVTVADGAGLSYYSDQGICQLLPLDGAALARARRDLDTAKNLIDRLFAVEVFLTITMLFALTVAVVNDARERAEKAQHQSEQRLRSILANAPAVIGMVDRKGKLLFINRSGDNRGADNRDSDRLFREPAEDDHHRARGRPVRDERHAGDA
jgi:PAS domain-containing protein